MQSHFATLPHNDGVLGSEFAADLQTSHSFDDFQRVFINGFAENCALAIQLGTHSRSDSENVAVSRLHPQIHHRQQTGFIMVQQIIFILEERVLAPDGKLGFAVDSVRHEVSPFDELLLDYAVKTSIFVAGGHLLPQELARAKLPKVLGCLRTDVFEQLKGDSAYFLLVRVEVKENHGIVLRSNDSCHHPNYRFYYKSANPAIISSASASISISYPG